MLNLDPRMRLLNPGPVTLTQRVRTALAGPDLCHREAEFSKLLAEVRQRLGRVYPDADRDYTPVLLTGSGTAAVEAMVGSLVPRGGKALVAANGVYGERIAQILRLQGKDCDTVCAEWTLPIDLDAVARKLDADRFTHAIGVHHETTTGRLNDIAALGDVCGRRGVPLLLDTVSSFGGEPIDFAGGNIEACAATANKCLHGVPGISFVLVKKQALQNGLSAAPSLYLDLFRQYAEQCQGNTPFTPAIQALYAFREALTELEEEGGWKSRHAAYQARTNLLRSGLQALGLRLLLEEDSVYSCTLTSFHLPQGIPFGELHDRLKESGFVIYSGQYYLQASIFRIAVMGDLSIGDIEELVDAIAVIMRRSGLPTPRLQGAR